METRTRVNAKKTSRAAVSTPAVGVPGGLAHEGETEHNGNTGATSPNARLPLLNETQLKRCNGYKNCGLLLRGNNNGEAVTYNGDFDNT